MNHPLAVTDDDSADVALIDPDKKAQLLSRAIDLLGQVSRAEHTDELIHLGDELQSVGLVLRGELDLDTFLGA